MNDFNYKTKNGFSKLLHFISLIIQLHTKIVSKNNRTHIYEIRREVMSFVVQDSSIASSHLRYSSF